MPSDWEAYRAGVRRITGVFRGPPSPPSRVVWLPYVALALAPGGVLAGLVVGAVATPFTGAPNFYTFAFSAVVATFGFEVAAFGFAIAALVQCHRRGLRGGSIEVVCAWAALVLSAMLLLGSCLLGAATMYIAIQVMLG